MSDASLDQLASILTGLPTAPGAPLRQEDPTEFAIAAHGDQQYAGQPYLYHLQKVERILDDYGFLGFTWTAAAKLHDVIEDTHLDMTPEQRLEMIKEKFGEDVAALVWAVSGIGPNRKARNEDIYRKLGEHPKACILKLADRIANVEASIKDPATGQPNIPMARMYLKERARFTEVVKPHTPSSMWGRLDLGFDRLETLVTNAA
ncbi:metal-dependent phosphohydrolase [Caulobacter virus Karma]|uniref:HD-domain/PDEase-like protein n=6 Tax=Viruses TaxID=10239 RepID=J3U9J9_9CAUD|nr:metal-dependent phosphohydrolase [Caulobacter phage phiCbK]YP_006988849.1 metal-dependent phosphohydrolase [Caulobacter virus Magneto]YP_006989551.1 metal-dependent phosphohydrolase [Caulobacter virus Karma]YP_006989899.1 metal-dependent phosphohydrolase [Caulobacter phage CcrSwift]ARB15082.1 GTP pyrophosphokinase [Caulobacter phage Ccr32]ARB15416.1 GTP pyrophosphokinase [Caulobacter phage Ccr34]AFO71668.1 SpoT/RelA family (p)ppGpp synthetase I [Caulobacter phage phiCbK]AFU87001.1 putativ